MPEIQEIVFLDGLQDWIAPSAAESRISPTLEIPVVDFDMNAVLTIPEEVMAYPSYFQIDIRQYENADDPWGATGSSRILLFPQITGTQYGTPNSPPGEWVVPLHPTKLHIRMALANVLEGVNWGKVTFKLRYEVMASAVYERLMRAKRVTEKQIEACASQVNEHEAAKVAAEAKQMGLELESALWDNFLSEEIAQYEALTGGE